MECQCDEAARNRKKRCPDPVTTFPPNEDGEVVCVWCWEVLDAPYMRAKAN